jgi:phthalate 4,5-dioxygenase oxygenase subunit
MLNRKLNDLLTRTGPKKPMGQLFRAFWQPALLSRELPEPDCPPKMVKVLGETMLAFRDTSGRAQFITPWCPHRMANLYYGRVEEGGIRCAYHGWKFDADGNCLEIPTLPTKHQEERFCKKIKLKTYPTREAGGLLWVYLGAEETPPELPELEFLTLDLDHSYVSKKYQDSNYAQALEGAIDTAHFTFLHMPLDNGKVRFGAEKFVAQSSADEQRVEWIRADGSPRFKIIKHECGMVLGGARHADEGDNYWRVSQFLMPNIGLAPNAFPGENMHLQIWVPIDSKTCWIYNATWNPDRALSKEEVDRYSAGASIHAETDENWMPVRNASNDYMIDREEQKYRTFTGIKGVSEQDAAIQESMGPVVDRTKENLNSTDLGVIEWRRMMMDAATTLFNEGVLPPALSHPGQYKLRSGSYVCSKDISFEDAMVQRFGHRLGLAGGDGSGPSGDVQAAE